MNEPSMQDLLLGRGDAHSVLRPHGHIIIVGDGPVIEADTLQCVHCGGHFIVRPGSGRQRGFCMRCNGVTCGHESCNACNPFQKLVDEGRR